VLCIVERRVSSLGPRDDVVRLTGNLIRSLACIHTTILAVGLACSIRGFCGSLLTDAVWHSLAGCWAARRARLRVRLHQGGTAHSGEVAGRANHGCATSRDSRYSGHRSDYGG